MSHSQIKDVPERHNIMRGEFKKPGQRDLALLRPQEHSSIIFVYWNESAKNPTPLALLNETLTPSKRGSFRILHVAGEKFIRSHHDASAPGMDPLPKVLDHDGIDDGIFEKRLVGSLPR
jgi:hypothetical protein